MNNDPETTNITDEEAESQFNELQREIWTDHFASVDAFFKERKRQISANYSAARNNYWKDPKNHAPLIIWNLLHHPGGRYGSLTPEQHAANERLRVIGTNTPEYHEKRSTISKRIWSDPAIGMRDKVLKINGVHRSSKLAMDYWESNLDEFLSLIPVEGIRERPLKRIGLAKYKRSWRKILKLAIKRNLVYKDPTGRYGPYRLTKFANPVVETEEEMLLKLLTVLPPQGLRRKELLQVMEERFNCSKVRTRRLYSLARKRNLIYKPTDNQFLPYFLTSAGRQFLAEQQQESLPTNQPGH